jgi:hypothetical protein
MTDDVLKYQSVKIAENVDAQARQVEPDVKLPGDPEVPERAAREPEPFGGEDRGFPDRVRDIPDEAAIEGETE